jgi:hypothetical protein
MLAGYCADEPSNAKANSGQPDKSLAIADFEDGKAMTQAGIPWVSFTDESVGGKSTMSLTVSTNGAQGSKGALKISAKLTPEFQWGGFVGARAWLQADGSPKDMSKVTGVRFYARGDGRKYRLLVSRENVKDGNHFAYEFTAPTEWKLFQVSFSKLAQSPYFGEQIPWSATNITGLGFLAFAESGTTAEGRLEIDNVSFYVDE